jgi:hypothetical protein
MNPNPDRDELTLAIDEVNAACDLDVARETATHYGLSKTTADKIINEVSKAVSAWRKGAADLGIPKSEQKRLERAFRT